MKIEELEKELIGKDKKCFLFFRIGNVTYPIMKVEEKIIGSMTIVELSNQ